MSDKMSQSSIDDIFANFKEETVSEDTLSFLNEAPKKEKKRRAGKNGAIANRRHV